MLMMMMICIHKRTLFVTSKSKLNCVQHDSVLGPLLFVRYIADIKLIVAQDQHHPLPVKQQQLISCKPVKNIPVS